jgi:hypothetical protein
MTYEAIIEVAGDEHRREAAVALDDIKTNITAFVRAAAKSTPSKARADHAVAQVERVSHCYGTTVALDDVTIDIPAHRMIGVIGPDGVGKSTLLALIAGVRMIQQGQVRVFDGDMADKAHRWPCMRRTPASACWSLRSSPLIWLCACGGARRNGRLRFHGGAAGCPQPSTTDSTPPCLGRPSPAPSRSICGGR